MWIYENITRREFESIKDTIEKYIVILGGNKISLELPYEQRTHSFVENDFIENLSTRNVFEYNGEYYRVDEICFPDKPFVVIECGTYVELINNTMEDADSFPYDLEAEELLKEVKYSLGIEQYPDY